MYGQVDIMNAFHHGHNIYDDHIEAFHAPIIFYTSKEMFKWVEIAVMAAQQLYHNLDGRMRKEYVVRFLERKGYDVDTQEVDSAIEAAVLKLHQELEEAV